VDDDIVEPTNLNRLHGSTQPDADAMMGKADVAAREIARMGLGVRVVPLKGWANIPFLITTAATAGSCARTRRAIC
jgi:molybdopterin/thiamine biosynthesis adenylyltransferase